MGKGTVPQTGGWGAKPTRSIVNLIINYVIAEKQWRHVINRTTSERCRDIRPATPRAQGGAEGNRCSSPLISRQPQSVKELVDVPHNV